MTRLFNEPSSFADEMIEGFVAASGRWVRAVPGGVARSTRAPQGQVAVVIGGGSGHYPAFGGMVGTGLAHGAASAAAAAQGDDGPGFPPIAPLVVILGTIALAIWILVHDEDDDDFFDIEPVSP